MGKQEGIRQRYINFHIQTFDKVRDVLQDHALLRYTEIIKETHLHGYQVKEILLYMEVNGLIKVWKEDNYKFYTWRGVYDEN